MADRPDIILTIGNDLNLSREWQKRQDKRDELEFASVIEAAGATGPTGGEQAKPGGEGKTKTAKSEDENKKYDQMRAAEGPEGGIYDATKPGRSGYPDEGPIQDPIKAMMTALDQLTRNTRNDPTMRGSAPGTPGDVTRALETIRKIAASLKRGRKAVEAAGQELSVVNTARLDAEASVKQTVTKLDSLLGKPKPTTTHQETIEGAETVGLTLEEVLTTPDSVWQMEALRFKKQALRDLHTKMATEVKNLKEATKAGDQAAADQLVDAVLLTTLVGDKTKLMGTGAGQLLEANKVMANAERAGYTMEQMREVAERLAIQGANGLEEVAALKARLAAEGVDGFALAKILDQIPKGQHRSFMQRVWRAYKYTNDALHWAFLNSVLSNPVTHAANTLGTGVATAAHFPERYVAEWINRAFFRDATGVQRGETMAMVHTFGRAVSDGWRMLKKAIVTGEQPFVGPSRVETRFDLSAKQFGWDVNTPAGKLVDTVGMVMPTRLMMAEDALYKGFNKRVEISALALREGMARAAAGESAAEVAARVRALEEAAIEARPQGAAIIKAAEAAASLRTLNAPLGVAGRAAMTVRDTVPLGFYVFPFVQTPTNSIKWTWQRAPVLSAFSIQNWKDIFEGGAARDLALSRMLLGSAIGGAVAYHVVQGNITGGLPAGANKNLQRDLRELGPREFVIKVGDEYFGYKRTDPVGGYIGTIATGIEIYSQLSHADPQEFDYEDFAIASVLAAGRVALDTPWLMGLSNVIDAIERPGQEGKKLALGFGRAIVPGIVRQGQATGWQGLTEDYPELREFHSFGEQMLAGAAPWTVPPVLHPILGHPIRRPAGWGPDMVSPIFVTERVPWPVLDEIIKHKMEFREPSRMIFGQEDNELTLDPSRQPDGIKLSDPHYFRLKQLATQEWRDGSGRNLNAAMEAEIQSDGYRRASPGPDNGKEIRLKQIYSDAYRWARIQLQEEYPSLKAQVDAKRRQRLQEKLPEDSPDALRRPQQADMLQKLLQSIGR